MTDLHTVPPHSNDAEQAVLGGLLVDNGAIDRLGDLRAEAFYGRDNRVVYEQIQRLLMANRPADVLTVSDALAAAGHDIPLAYVHGLAASVPGTANIGRYAEIVRETALRRALLSVCMQASALATDRSKTAAEVLDAVQGEFGKLADTTTRREPAPIQEALARYVDDLDCRYHGEASHPGIPTGLADLDTLLNGGLRRGALVTLGARPGMGKSALGETVACNAAQGGYSVLFLSMEMPEAEVTERSIAMVGRVSASVLASADRQRMDAGDMWPRLTYAVQSLQDAKLFIDDEPGLTLMQVVTKARAIKRRHGLDLLVVDYLQLMTGGEEKRYQQIEAITKGLKILAKTLNIAVLALSQFSRDIEKRPNPRPKSSDFRDSGSIEQDSDILLGLYREEQDKPETEWKGMAELFVMKNRQGKTGKVALSYLGDFMRFDNFTGRMPSDDRQQAPRRGGFEG